MLLILCSLQWNALFRRTASRQNLFMTNFPSSRTNEVIQKSLLITLVLSLFLSALTIDGVCWLHQFKASLGIFLFWFATVSNLLVVHEKVVKLMGNCTLWWPKPEFGVYCRWKHVQTVRCVFEILLFWRQTQRVVRVKTLVLRSDSGGGSSHFLSRGVSSTLIQWNPPWNTALCGECLFVFRRVSSTSVQWNPPWNTTLWRVCPSCCQGLVHFSTVEPSMEHHTVESLPLLSSGF